MRDSVVEQPTYLGHVRHFFDQVDVDHMAARGIDLSTYEGLKTRAASVHARTRPPNATMPPEPERRWSAERSQTFSNWIRNGFPLGEPIPQTPTTDPNSPRLRKDARELDADEIATLGRAFQEVMRRDADHDQGYFALAGEHWFPAPSECLHHEDRFGPWHRVYLLKFEDALRSVPGAESVTLPYWDITDLPPAFLFDAPFTTYTLPESIHSGYPKGYATTRSSREAIAEAVANEDIPGIIDDALKQPTWSDFIAFRGRGLEAAHDVGHPATGLTMANADAAAFDPIFWLFHANWDRLWWQWQQIMSATTLTTFRSTIMGSTDFLTTPPFNELPPFDTTADRTIDLSEMGISYTQPVGRSPDFVPSVGPARAGSLAAFEGVRVRDALQASVRLKGIDRLSIPGTFRVILRADGEVVGRRTFFQSTEPVDCANCRERAKIDLDFLVDVDKLLGKTLTASIDVVTPGEDLDAGIPLESAGDPTLNVRLLLERL